MLAVQETEKEWKCLLCEAKVPAAEILKHVHGHNGVLKANHRQREGHPPEIRGVYLPAELYEAVEEAYPRGELVPLERIFPLPKPKGKPARAEGKGTKETKGKKTEKASPPEKPHEVESVKSREVEATPEFPPPEEPPPPEEGPPEEESTKEVPPKEQLEASQEPLGEYLRERIEDSHERSPKDAFFPRTPLAYQGEREEEEEAPSGEVEEQFHPPADGVPPAEEKEEKGKKKKWLLWGAAVAGGGLLLAVFIRAFIRRRATAVPSGSAHAPSTGQIPPQQPTQPPPTSTGDTAAGNTAEGNQSDNADFLPPDLRHLRDKLIF
jgi:hypothetical protein